MLAPTRPAALPPAHPAPTLRPRLPSQALLQGHGEVEIDHQGVLYRLRVTALGKLILTK
jgi:hemin uptake protein HemP